MTYRKFISSSRWQRLRAYHLKHHPLCQRCQAQGRVTVASEVHHVLPCGDDPALQTDPLNLDFADYITNP
jgi:5-methylcytosine-specific restriction endonuclease McrA